MNLHLAISPVSVNLLLFRGKGRRPIRSRVSCFLHIVTQNRVGCLKLLVILVLLSVLLLICSLNIFLIFPCELEVLYPAYLNLRNRYDALASVRRLCLEHFRNWMASVLLFDDLNFDCI